MAEKPEEIMKLFSKSEELLEMFRKKFFDVIYHEHLSFFALEPLLKFFGDHDMKVFDVKKGKKYGGGKGSGDEGDGPGVAKEGKRVGIACINFFKKTYNCLSLQRAYISIPQFKVHFIDKVE